MAYTTNYGIEKPVIGQKQWGEVVNRSLDTIDTEIKNTDNKITNHMNNYAQDKQNIQGSIDTLNSSLAENMQQINDISLNVKQYIFLVENWQSETANWTQAIQKALDDVALVGGGNVLIPSGVYCVYNTLRIDSRTNLVMTPNTIIRKYMSGTIICTKDRDTDLEFDGVHDIRIQGGVLDNRGIEQTVMGNSITINHASNVIIKDVTILDVAGAHAIELNSTSTAWINKCRFYGYKDTGGRTFSEAIQIDIALPGSGGGLVQDGTASCNIFVTECVFGTSKTEGMGAWPRGIGSHTSSYNKPYENIHVVNNRFEVLKQQAVEFINVNDLIIDNNILINVGAGFYITQAPIDHQNSYSYDAVAQTFTPQGKVLANKNITITNNQFKNSVSYAQPIKIEVETTGGGGGFDNVTISNNLIMGVGGSGNAIKTYNLNSKPLVSSSLRNVTITNNKIYNTSSSAISMGGLNRAIIQGNNVDGANSNGISLGMLCENVVIVGNTVTHTGVHSIFVGGTGVKNINIIGNVIAGADNKSDGTGGCGIRCSGGGDTINIANNVIKNETGYLMTYAISAKKDVINVTENNNICDVGSQGTIILNATV